LNTTADILVALAEVVSVAVVFTVRVAAEVTSPQNSLSTLEKS